MKKRTLLLKSLLHTFFLTIFLSSFCVVFGSTTYYVATNGSDSNTGTSAPFLTVKYAITKAVAGDTIYVRAGTYSITSTLSISKSGTSTSKYYLFVYPGDERPVLDFTGIALGSRGVTLSGSYWYIKGIRIKKAGDNGINISGAYNTLEFCDFSENLDGGCQLGGGAHDNRIINCDSYLNADYIAGNSSYTGGNADGFSPKLDVGTNNYFYGCRAWLNSDDGWDGYLRPADGVTTTLENCWTWKNGYLKDGVTTTSSMNGNGFKLGGSDTKNLRHNFIVKNCLAFNNKANGFDQNSNTGSITIYNGTSANNGGKNIYLNSNVTLPVGSVFTVKNTIAYGATGTSIRSGTVLSNNQFAATAVSFISVDSAGVTAPRKADGSLPDITFMHLANGSSYIDAGLDVGLPYNGNAPDLGSFETGNTSVLYTLTTGVASGSGTVSPSGITKLYSSNTISIAATPAANYIFDKWTDGSGNTVSTYNPYTVNMAGGDITIKANFSSAPQYTLTTSVSSGNGTISPASGTLYYSGNTASLTATPAANYTFVSWGGDASGTSATTSVIMNADKNVTASFALVKRTLTLVITPISSGTVSPATGTTYDHGASIKLTATPAAGYIFDKWTYNAATLSSHDTVTVTMDADKSITANFKLNTGVDPLNTTAGNAFNVWYDASDAKLIFNLDSKAKASIELYSLQGRLMIAVNTAEYAAGNHSIDLGYASLVKGVYLCKLVMNGKVMTRKVVVY